MKTYTVSDAALVLDCTTRTVSRYCKAMGIKKHGRDYQLTASDLERLATKIQPRPGRPPA